MPLPKNPVRPERSAQRVVEGRLEQTLEPRPSTLLRTNDFGSME